MLAGGGVGFVVTLGLTPLAIVVLRRVNVLDHPSARSSHDAPTVRGGGIAPAIAILAGTIIASEGHSGPVLLALLMGSVLFGAIGLAEDLHGVPPLPRLWLLTLAAAAATPLLIRGMDEPAAIQVGAALVVGLWLVAYVNAYNFMDGINGISCAQAVVAGAAWVLAGEVEHVPLLSAGGAVVAAAALGFAPFNFPAARIFLGDVGSYFVGAWLAILAVVGIRAGVPAEAVVAPLALYLADTGTTLVRRFFRHERWYLPHRDHAYQQLVRSGWSHTRTTTLVATTMAACACLGAVSLTELPAGARFAADAGIVCLIATYTVAARRAGAPERPAHPAHSS